MVIIKKKNRKRNQYESLSFVCVSVICIYLNVCVIVIIILILLPMIESGWGEAATNVSILLRFRLQQASHSWSAAQLIHIWNTNTISNYKLQIQAFIQIQIQALIQIQIQAYIQIQMWPQLLRQKITLPVSCNHILHGVQIQFQVQMHIQFQVSDLTHLFWLKYVQLWHGNKDAIRMQDQNIH